MKAAVTSGRETALLALCECGKQGGWSDGVLKRLLRQNGLDRREAALATRLCFGVLQNRMLLDHYIGTFSNTPVDRLEDKVLTILRLGLYQMTMLDKIPVSAAVNESVNLARRYVKNRGAAGFVNGVLRAAARGGRDLPLPEDPAARYSHPRWLVEEFARRLPDGELEQLLQADNSAPDTLFQLNGVKCALPDLCRALEEDGVSVRPHPWLSDCLEVRDTGDVERLRAFRQGLFYIQDAAAKTAVLAAAPEPGMRVLDACAAPGGKSFAAAIQMENRGEVVSCDIHPHKIKLIRAGADRLGLTCVRPMLMDASRRNGEFAERFDLVIADVPCSGLGVIRKKPDIRYKDPEPLKRLPEVQSAILENVSGYVIKGGVLLYSTCTLLERENEQVVDAFLAAHPEFRLEAAPVPAPLDGASGQLTLWPHRHGTDGFYIARMRRSL